MWNPQAEALKVDLVSTTPDSEKALGSPRDMSTDWAKLKAKRASRAGTSPAAAASVPPSSSSNANDATSSHRTEAQGAQRYTSHTRGSTDSKSVAAATVASSTRVDYCHPDLPSSLPVHQIPLRGRGVVAQQSYSPGALNPDRLLRIHALNVSSGGIAQVRRCSRRLPWFPCSTIGTSGNDAAIAIDLPKIVSSRKLYHSARSVISFNTVQL